MTVDVLARDVRDELLIPIGNGIENQKALAPDRAVSEDLRGDVKTQFKWHVEPRKTIGRRQLDARQVMHAEPAMPDDPLDLVQPHGSGVQFFERAPRREAARHDGEHDGLERRPVLLVKGTVDEDRTGERGGPSWHRRGG